MKNLIDRRLEELGIVLPKPAAPVAQYVPYVVSGRLVHLSGQVAFVDGGVLFPGTLGKDVSVEQGRLAARQCFINLLAQLRNACAEDLSTVQRVVRLGGFVAATMEFSEHSKVMDGASGLAADVFGERGRHARTTVGVASLPLGASVEVEALFELA